MYEFDKCIIFFENGNHIANGVINKFDSDSVGIYANEKIDDRLGPADEVLVYIYDGVKGECRYRGTVARCGMNSLELTGVELVSTAQKRENTRVEKQVRYRITHYYRDKQKVKFEKPVEITILNISAQGFYMNCDHRFESGFRFAFLFRETKRPIPLIVEILRREDYARSFNYGCKFVNIKQKDMDEIFRFVLHEQILQRRRSLMF